MKDFRLECLVEEGATETGRRHDDVGDAIERLVIGLARIILHDHERIVVNDDWPTVLQVHVKPVICSNTHTNVNNSTTKLKLRK